MGSHRIPTGLLRGCFYGVPPDVAAMDRTAWYDSRIGKTFYWGIIGFTLAAVIASVTVTEVQIPWVVYLFGFLGATVYAFTSFAKRFDEDERYRLKIMSRTIAVLPLAAGVYMLAFAFPGVEGDLSALNATAINESDVNQADRLVAGVVFLAGIYVSATLRALGGLAERLLGVESEGGDQGDAAEADEEQNEESNQ